MKKAASGYKLIFGYIGLFLIFIGVACLLPLFAIFAFPDEASDWKYFVIPGIPSIAIGVGLMFLFLFKKEKVNLEKHQDSVLLVLGWIISIVIGAIPFILKGSLSVTDSFFETTSAFATVGLSTFKAADFEAHLFVLYRSLLCFFGGVGLVLVITSVISNRYGLRLYVAEGHNDKLMPNIARSARTILSIYFGIIVIGIIAYIIAGLEPFDAIIHSISAVATGGFSSRPGGLMTFADMPSFPAIEIISVVLMLLGSMNFLLHMFFITGKFKRIFKDVEFRLLGILILIFVPLYFLAAFAGQGFTDPLSALRHGSFTFVSALTTTGFTNWGGVFGDVATITKAGQGIIFLIVITNIIGGGMGSTAGGVKQYRLAIIGKSFYWSTVEKLSSHNYIYPHYVWRFGDQREVKAKEAIESFGYIFIYVLLMFVGALFISIFDKFTFGESLFEFSNALSSTGLSNGICANGNNITKWILTFGMIAGRLEILVIYFAFYRMIRDILRKDTI